MQTVPGIICKDKGDDFEIPGGVIMWKKDQLALGPRTATYVSLTLVLDSLVEILHVELGKLGYSMLVHEMLKQIQDGNVHVIVVFA